MKPGFISAAQAETSAAKLAGDSGLCEGQPWDHIESIWDEWNNSVAGAWSSDRYVPLYSPTLGLSVKVQHFCAVGFLRHRHGFRRDAFFLPVNVRDASFDVYIDKDTARRYAAVNVWLSEHGLGSIMTANDRFHWTPEQFRDLDRRLEYEYQTSQLAKQVDAIAVERHDFAVCETVSPVGGKSNS